MVFEFKLENNEKIESITMFYLESETPAESF